MPHSNINPDHRPDKQEKLRQAQLDKVKKQKAPKKADLQGAAMMYKAMGQIWRLVETCHHFQVGGVSQVSPASELSQIESISDPRASVGDFVDAYNASGYLENPTEFYSSLAGSLVDCDGIDSDYFSHLFTGGIKSLLCPNLVEPESKRSLAFCIADAHLKKHGDSGEPTMLQRCLAILFGNTDPLVGSTVTTYQNCQSNHLPIPNIKKHQQVIAANLTQVAPWQKEYTQLMQDLNKGDLNIAELIKVVEGAPKGSEVQMKHLEKVMEPLLKNAPKEALSELGKEMAQHFQHKKDAAEKAFIEFIVKYRKACAKAYGKSIEHIQAAGVKSLAENQGTTPSESDLSGATLDKHHGAGSNAINKAIKDWKHHVIHDLPIMMALYIMLMSGKGIYGYLAKIMSNLNVSMGNIKKFINDLKAIQDGINDMMKSSDPGQLSKDAQSIADHQKDLNNLISTLSKDIGPDLAKSLSEFAGLASGSLDKALAAGCGVSTWSQVVGNADALKKMHEYMAGTKGGATPPPVTKLIKNMSDLMGSLNTQNQGDVQKLNMTTKKVDSMTKLFAASITMYKGLVQTLSNMSGS